MTVIQSTREYPAGGICAPVSDRRIKQKRLHDMSVFNYGAEAELFPTKNRRSKSAPFAYRRFERAADAIRFAVEELPADAFAGAYLEVGEVRFDRRGIRELYDAEAYPHPRPIVEAAADEPEAETVAVAAPAAPKSKSAQSKSAQSKTAQSAHFG